VPTFNHQHPDKQLTVVIPGLLPPATMLDNLLHDIRLPALTTLLQHAQRTQENDIPDLESLLATLTHTSRQHDWPLAPIMAQHDHLPATEGYWLCADPVYLTPARNQLLLTDASVFDLDSNDSQALITAFQQHFGEEYALFAPHPKRWYLHIPHAPDLRTYPPSTICGQGIDAFLPTGKDAMAWHRFYNEVQMLFFSLPVNASRQQRGLPPVNGIWCWGGGTLPTPSASPFQTVWGNSHLLSALANQQHCQHAPLPHHQQQGMTGLVLLDALQQSLQYGDYHVWQNTLQQLETDWFEFLLTQLRQGKLQTLHLWSLANGTAYHWRISKNNLWRFWRRAPLDTLLTTTYRPEKTSRDTPS
jgi:hypothetical protein